jgi:5-methylcytosine-specific restriction endonuclease McrA
MPVPYELATTEHVIPISRGGPKGGMDNVKMACAECNSKKGNRLLSELDIKRFKKVKNERKDPLTSDGLRLV